MTLERFRRVAFAASLICCLAAGVAASSQEVEAPRSDRLKQRIEERWRVVPLEDGLLLVPRRASVQLKGVEIGERGIAIDGQRVSGAELEARLGADAAAVLELSYRPAGERLALFAPQPQVEGRLDADQQRREPVPVERDAREERRREHYAGTRVRVFGSITIPEGQRVGDVVAVFGSIDLRGTATGNVVAIGGDVTMGPNAVARQDVVSVGGAVRASRIEQVLGHVSELRFDFPNFRIDVPGDEQVSVQVSPDWARIASIQWVSALIGSVLVFAICCFTVLVAPRGVQAAREASRSVFTCALVGLATQVLTLPALLLIASALTLSVIGIPLLALLPVVLLLLLGASILGFTGFAARVGSLPLLRRQHDVSVFAVVAGLVLILATSVAGRFLWAESGGHSGLGLTLALIGAGIEYLCWTIGLGAAVMAGLARRPPAAALAPAPEPASAGI